MGNNKLLTRAGVVFNNLILPGLNQLNHWSTFESKVYRILRIDSRIVLLCIALLLISLIGFLDYRTGGEMSFSIFYLIPLSLLALYQKTSFSSVIVCSVYATILWFLADYYTREYSFTWIPVWNAFVRMAIFTTISILILKLKDKQKKLKNANESLKTLNEEKNQFIGVAAHDLRNPLSGIYSFADLLLRKKLANSDPETKEELNIIKNLSGNSLHILQNLLDISLIEAGKIELEMKKNNYIEFISGQVEINRLLAKRKNISINLEILTGSIEVLFDRTRLSEVTDNLLSNAIKYSPISSVITVKVSMDTGRVLTEVMDQGKGIPLEEQELLFRYFQKTSTQPTAGEKSTGLGLAIARQIVILHQGEIGVKSKPGEGSNFYFVLPAV